MTTGLRYDVADHVATITLDRPEKKNAFTLAMLDNWATALHDAERDPDVRAVVLTGAGDAFCAGVDLEDYAGARPPGTWGEKSMLTGRVHQIALAMENLTKPVIAAVNGVAYGAGMDMSLMCDLRLAGRSARFCEAYVNVGLVPGDGGCWYLPRIIGTAQALRLLWLGEVVDAEEALRLGLVLDVVDDDALQDRAQELARRLAAKPPIAVQLIKRAVREGERHDLRTALDLISSHQAVVGATDDAREARAAFLERRPGVFVGR